MARITKGDRQTGETAADYLKRVCGECPHAYRRGMDFVEDGLSDDEMDLVLGLPSGTFGHALNDAAEDGSPYLKWGIMVARARAELPGNLHHMGRRIEEGIDSALRSAMEFEKLEPEDLVKVLAGAAGTLSRLVRIVNPEALHGTRRIKESLEDTTLRVSLHPGMESLTDESMGRLADILTSMASGGEVSPDLRPGTADMHDEPDAQVDSQG